MSTTQDLVTGPTWIETAAVVVAEKRTVVSRRVRPGSPELVDPYKMLADRWATGRLARGEITALTAGTYRNTVAGFAKTVRVKPEALRRRDIEHWLVASELASGSIQSRLPMLRKFCRWLMEEGLLAKDPTFGVKGPRPGSQAPGQPRPGSPELVEPYADLVERWAGGRFRRGEIAAGTLTAYRYNMGSFARTVRVKPAALTRSDIEHWLEVANLAPATARSQLSQLRTFCRWLAEEGIVPKDPTFGVKGPREPRRLPRGLPHADVDGLLEASPDTRTLLVLLLMVQEGLRRKEVVGLHLGDIDMAERTMLVVGKGDHERVLPISAETWRALTNYLAEWPAKAGPLIRSFIDGRSAIQAATAGRMVSEMMFASGAKKASYDGRSAHALRHTMATDMLKGGAHIRDVQAALGHATIVSTQRYLPLVVNDLRQAMGGRNYRGRALTSPPPAATQEVPGYASPHVTATYLASVGVEPGGDA